jgi:SAM-dependent methyltransferase
MKDAAARYAAGYGARAEEYARVVDPAFAPVATRSVELAGVRAGADVLDLATGTGSVARAAAQAGASVVGVDVSAGMIEVAQRLSPPDISFQVADATALPFAPRSFDAVTCVFAFSHLPDPGAAVAELLRVMRDRAALVQASWGSRGRNAAFRAVADALEEVTGGAPRACADIMDEGTWADPAHGMATLRDAGLREVEVLTEPLQGRFGSRRAAFEWVLIWPSWRQTIDALAGAQRAEFESLADRRLARVHDLSWEYDVNYYVARRGTPR